MAVNLKELSKRPVPLSPGHRACAGCGSIIAIKLVLMAAEDPVVCTCATGCMEVVTTIYPYTAWRVPFMHNAFENSAATMSGIETAYRSLKKQGKLNREIKFIAFGGDGGTYDIGLQSLSGAMERGHDMLYVCYDNEAYMNCLALSTEVLTKDGLKKITEVKPGELVYAFDQKTHQISMKKCMGVFDNGRKEVFELSTLHHTIKATGNHPFLTVQRHGRGRENTLEWKTLDQLKKGDRIVVLKQLNNGKSFRFNSFNKSKIGDPKVNRLNEVNLPDSSSPDMMEFFGLYTGDGWSRLNKGEVGFALPEGKQARNRLMMLLEYPSQYKYQNFLIGNKFFETQRVKSIRSVGIEPTLDLQVEGEHNFIADGIVVHNTGIQRSGSTPMCAATSTSPVGRVEQGKKQYPKDLTKIMAAHHIPYVAQASPHRWMDLMNKTRKALKIKGPKFINIIASCHRGWRLPMHDSLEVCGMAVETCFWPLFEVEDDVWKLNYRPKEKPPITEWFKMQKRFQHLLKGENAGLVRQIQEMVDRRWEEILSLCGEKNA